METRIAELRYKEVISVADGSRFGYVGDMEVDLESGQVDSTLTVILVCGDGHEFEFSYPLHPAEQELLRQKMEDYCQQMTGQSLEEYGASLHETPADSPSEMQTM